MHDLRRLTGLFLGALIVIAACGPANSGPSEPPGGSAPPAGPVDAEGPWSLVAGRVDGAAVPLAPGAPVTLIVEGMRIGGTAACNSYGAELTLEGGALAVGDIVQTEMACADPIMASEAAYLRALAGVRAAHLDGDVLVLSGPTVELRFTRLAPPPTAELVDTPWVLDTLVDGEVAAAPAAQGETPTLLLGSDGTVRGTTGCRTFSGRFVEAADEIVFTEFAVDGACPPALEAQDAHVIEVLGDGFRAAVHEGRLTIAARGTRELVYRVGVDE